MIGLFFALAAAAAPAGLYDLGLVLRGEGEFYSGVGAPTVEWRGDTGEYVMYFESAADPARVPEGCANSFQIGRATSLDGVSWSIDPAPVYGADPVEGSPRRCSVSQPAVVYDGTRWNLFYSASTLPHEGASTNAPSGIAWATSADGIAWTAEDELLVPYTDASIGLSSVVALNGTLYVAFTLSPDIWMLSRPISGGAWSEPARVLDHAAVGDWSSHWVHGPSLRCDETAARPLTMLFGGDTEDAFVRSLGWADSAEGTTWTVAADGPMAEGTLDYTQLNHWDVLGAGDGVVAWYSRTDPETEAKAIGVAVSDALLGAPSPRACPNPWATPGDTGGTDTAEDTGSVGDTGEEVPDDEAPEDCGCATGGEAAPLGGLLVVTALLRRRLTRQG